MISNDNKHWTASKYLTDAVGGAVGARVGLFVGCKWSVCIGLIWYHEIVKSREIIDETQIILISIGD